MLKTELEKYKEDTDKACQLVIDLLYPGKSFGDIRVEDYNKIITLMRGVLGIPEPKEDE
tara:strand:- start:16837 stop:17013 length:177 start_codon:yes stop_codon:yes gene_type:complete